MHKEKINQFIARALTEFPELQEKDLITTDSDKRPYLTIMKTIDKRKRDALLDLWYRFFPLK